MTTTAVASQLAGVLNTPDGPLEIRVKTEGGKLVSFTQPRADLGTYIDAILCDDERFHDVRVFRDAETGQDVVSILLDPHPKPRFDR